MRFRAALIQQISPVGYPFLLLQVITEKLQVQILNGFDRKIKKSRIFDKQLTYADRPVHFRPVENSEHKESSAGVLMVDGWGLRQVCSNRGAGGVAGLWEGRAAFRGDPQASKGGILAP